MRKMNEYLLPVAMLLVSIAVIFVHTGPLEWPLKSQVIFNTHPFSCTEKMEWKTEAWTNSSNDTLRIRKVQVWGGMGEGNIADLGFFVVRKSDNTNLAIGNQDHYKDGELFLMYDFAPDYIALAPGESLLFGYQCNVWNSRQGTGHLIITIWYSET